MRIRLWSVTFLIVMADQLLKMIVRGYPQGTVLFEVPYMIRITHCENTGAAFSMLSKHPVFLTILSIALLTALWIFINRSVRLALFSQIALHCLLGGGVGNLIDRALRGAVTDYIQLQMIDFPVFNLADLAITGAVGAMILLLLIGKFEMPTGEKHGTDD